MTEYNPDAPQALEIVIDDVNQVATIDGQPFPWAFNGGAIQIGHIAGSDPWVRLQVPADVVRRITDQGTTVFSEPNEPFVDPDFEPDGE